MGRSSSMCPLRSIRRIGCDRLAVRFDRRAVLIQLLLHLAEREPGRGKPGGEFRRLRHQIRGCCEIAAQLQVAREIVAPVGDQIA